MMGWKAVPQIAKQSPPRYRCQPSRPPGRISGTKRNEKQGVQITRRGCRCLSIDLADYQHYHHPHKESKISPGATAEPGAGHKKSRARSKNCVPLGRRGSGAPTAGQVALQVQQELSSKRDRSRGCSWKARYQPRRSQKRANLLHSDPLSGQAMPRSIATPHAARSFTAWGGGRWVSTEMEG